MTKIIAIKKGDVWYMKYPAYNADWKTVRVNGTPVSICPDSHWISMTTPPTAFEQLITLPNKLVGYKRKSEFANEQINAPDIVGLNYFAVERDCDYNNRPTEHAEYFGFYEPIYETQEPYWKLLEWEIVLVDTDCEPRTMKYPAKADFPHDVANYPETHHKYPCSISSDALFDILYPLIEAKVEASEFLSKDNFRNIKIVTVKRRITLAEPKEFKRNVSRLGAKIPKWQKWFAGNGWMTTFELAASSCGWLAMRRRHLNGRNRSDYEYERVPSLHGDNYDDLEKKIDAYIAEILSRLNDVEICECTECKGRGYIVKRPAADM